jgi:signal transduction histidine kinase
MPAAVGTPFETELRRAVRENTVVQFESDAIAPGRWHAVTASPAGSELSLFFQDISDTRAHLHELERLVDDRTAALQRLVADLETFSYTLVHDMRAPLRSISGFAEILAVDHAAGLDPEGQRHVARIRKSATRMDQLIMDILAYSQLSRGQPELRAIRLDDTLREILRAHAEFQPEQAEIEIETPLPVVRGNDALLTQCFFNLLHNATKFVAQGVKPRVRITGTVVGNVARIEIVDNGIGISPEAVARIFEPFHREHSHYEGTGIGLAIVRKAAEQLGGRAGVQSQPGQGSRFWLELPLAKATLTSSPGVMDTRVLV